MSWRFMLAIALLLNTLSLAHIAHAQNAPDAAAQFTALRDRHWQWSLDNSPSLARRVGDPRGDGHLEDVSLAHMDQVARDAQTWLTQLNAIDTASLPDDMALDAVLLRKMLQAQIDGARFGQRAMLFDSYSGWTQDILGDARDGDFTTRAEFNAYIARLAAFPRQAQQAQDTTRWALRHGFVQPCVVVAHYPQSLEQVGTPDAPASLFARPFQQKPAALSDDAWQALRTRALKIIAEQVLPAWRAYTRFIRSEYMPRCRTSSSIAATPQGAAYYQWRIAQETTTTLSADEIHARGLAEVARISAEMDKVAASAGYAGQRSAYIAHLRSDPRYYAKDAETLLQYSASIAKYIDGQLPRLFSTLPRLPYGVKAMPDDIAVGNTTAFYESGSFAQRRAGLYRVNTTALNQRPLFEIPALTAHEAMPGHHLQIALQQEMALSPQRRFLSNYTAYVEGWGLYAESLGREINLYDSPEKNMGRLSYEMWRACRLVVDTGLHAKGWSRAQAIAYMQEHTALSTANIDAEVTRYIGWPAQALGYKLGELSLQTLRQDAQSALGEAFDVRAFHAQILASGPLPLDILEARTRGWIAAQKAQMPPAKP